jgi:hypothetical protein
VSEFIKVFARFNEIKEDIKRGDQKHKIYKSLIDYMEIVKSFYFKSDMFKDYSSEESTDIIEDIENFIHKKMYK